MNPINSVFLLLLNLDLSLILADSIFIIPVKWYSLPLLNSKMLGLNFDFVKKLFHQQIYL